MWRCTAFRQHISTLQPMRLRFSTKMRHGLICAIFCVLFILARHVWMKCVATISTSSCQCIDADMFVFCISGMLEVNNGAEFNLWRMINYAFNFRQLLLRLRVWFKSVWFGFVGQCVWIVEQIQLFSSKPFGFYFHEIVPSSLSNNFNLKYAL